MPTSIHPMQVNSSVLVLNVSTLVFAQYFNLGFGEPWVRHPGLLTSLHQETAVTLVSPPPSGAFGIDPLSILIIPLRAYKNSNLIFAITPVSCIYESDNISFLDFSSA
ncbi:hypothetical protein BDZ94DRAFT_130273 [Collybia nuda]|uniref:Uncharacterized protein n=1 Tax=Collybia nuda TaxID=64659 RepID=A0A9P5YAR0_9AGAR|nr:hypothetical protein BDZ94DRAFT_130273 [Collybia nuda]